MKIKAEHEHCFFFFKNVFDVVIAAAYNYEFERNSRIGGGGCGGGGEEEEWASSFDKYLNGAAYVRLRIYLFFY